MENKIIEVVCTVGNEVVNLHVHNTIPYIQQKKIAKCVAENVVSDDGEYKPFDFLPLMNMLILTHYTNISFPEGWGDNQLMEFCSETNAKWQIIVKHINNIEVERMTKWALELIEYRKECYKKSFAERLIKDIAGLIEDFEPGLLENLKAQAK